MSTKYASSSGHAVVSPRRVLIVEDDHNGHRLKYVGILVSRVLEEGHVAILALRPQTLESVQMSVFLGRFRGRFESAVVRSGDLREIETLAERYRADHVVVPEADDILLPLLGRAGWRHRSTLTVLVMRATAPETRTSLPGLVRASVKWVVARLIACLPRIHVRVLQSSLSDQRFLGVLDPVDLVETDEAVARMREMLHSDRARTWFAVVGAISARKNVTLIADALVRSGCSDVGLLVAGKVDDSISKEVALSLAAFETAGGAVVLTNRILSDEELDAIISVVDALVVAHSNEGPSGVLTRAVALGTFVVTAGARSLRRDARQIGSGASWVPLNVDALAAEFTRVTALPLGELKPRDLSGSSTAFARRLLG